MGSPEPAQGLDFRLRGKEMGPERSPSAGGAKKCGFLRKFCGAGDAVMGAKSGSLTGPGEPLSHAALRAWATGARRTRGPPAYSLSGLARPAGAGTGLPEKTQENERALPMVGVKRSEVCGSKLKPARSS
jgi:hypothetical protein